MRVLHIAYRQVQRQIGAVRAHLPLARGEIRPYQIRAKLFPLALREINATVLARIILRIAVGDLSRRVVVTHYAKCE